MRWLDQQSLQDLRLPSVVVFELRYGVAILPDPRRRSSLEQGLDALVEQVIRERIALLAGMALAQGARLATRNTRHFDDTTIPLINPYNIF